jgi:Family of unknown function (DUF5906)
MKADLRPALKAYIGRIGAKEKSFSSYIIEEEIEAKYKREIVSITFNSDGAVDVKYLRRDKTLKEKKAFIAALLPTDKEKDAIKDEIKNYPFPKTIDAKDSAKFNGGLEKVPEGELFRFHARNDKKTLRMIQQRMLLKNGERVYLPWTFWNDGLWRNKGPDGGLPLFGLENFKPKTRRLLVHEGAGCAAFAQDIPDDHPWAADIKNERTANLAWVGGAYSFFRVDWRDIATSDPGIEVIFFADHDQSGENAIPQIAKILNRPVKVVRFDDRFPPTFDLKDPWPKRAEWWSEGKYIGPKLDDLLQSATWATDTIYNGKGRPSHAIRPHFAAEWFCVVTPEVFVLRSNVSVELIPNEFNNRVRSYSDVDDTARLLKVDEHSKVHALTFLPNQKSGLIAIDGKRLINTHNPSKIKAVKGNPKPFLDFMQHLIPDESDRLELLRWIATLIARPSIRMVYGVLLVSEMQGVGKGTLGEKVIAPLIGDSNISYPTEKEITESQFNYWCAHKRLAIVHEIYSGQTAKAYNTLKSTITDKNITVSKKYLANYQIENWMHIFACSNSMRPLKLSETDRRWLVPQVTEEKWGHDNWVKLHTWLEKEDNLGIIKQWAEDFVTEHGAVKAGKEAPATKTKSKMIDDSRSEGAQMAYDLGLVLARMEGEVLVPMKLVLNWVKEERGKGAQMESLDTLRKALLSAKGVYAQELKPSRERPRYLIEGQLTDVVGNFKNIPADLTREEILKRTKYPHDIMKSGA